MSTKSDILNKTWTLLPEEGATAGDAMDVDEVKATDDLLDEEMFVDMNTSSSCHLASNQTKILKNSLDETTANMSVCLKENLNVTINYDMNKISIEMNNLINRFSSLNDNCFESLFDETLNGIEFENGDPICISNPSSPKLAAKKETNINNLTINFDSNTNSMPHVTKLQSISTASGSPLSSSLSASIDNLDRFPANDEHLSFNPASVPKTFDLFMNDLRKSSSTFALNSQHSNSHSNLPSVTSTTTTTTSSTLSKRIMTSSVDKDLNKESLLDKQQKLTLKLNKLKEASINETKHDLKTSSPLKNKLFNSNLNRTIDLASNFASNESINESQQSFSISQSSSIANLAQFAQNNDDEDEPRTVFNTTYTSWSTNENQLQIDAYNQQKQTNIAVNSTVLLNRTQDMNNNNNIKDDLNKTKDIIHDDDESDENSNLNKTQDLNEPRVLNRTHNIDSTVSGLKQPGASQLRRVSSMQAPAVPANPSRPSSIYQKSKLLAPKPSLTVPTQAPSSVNQVKPESKLTRVPSISKQVVGQSIDTVKQKTAQTSLLPKVTYGLVSKSTSVNSPNKSPNSIQRPTTLSTKLTSSSVTSTSNSVNLNRLSSTSSSSSTSTSSSSSLKENKKSPINTTQTKSPTVPSATPSTASASKLTLLNNNNQNLVSKLKPPSFASSSIPAPASVCTNTTTTSTSVSSLPRPLGIPQPTNFTKPVAEPPVTKSLLKPPSQIPSFKAPSAIPTFRNATNQVKVI